MKTLKKISINPERVIKNEELVNLRGGFGGSGVNCYCVDSLGTVHLTDTIPDCSTKQRWINSNCWPQHQPYSYCDCGV